MIPKVADLRATALAIVAGVGVLQAGPLQPLPTSVGPTSRTLLVYSDVARPFSLMDVRGVVARLLSFASTEVVSMAAGEAGTEDFRDADYIVFLGLGPWEVRLPPGVPDAAKPVLVCGVPPGGSRRWPGGEVFGSASGMERPLADIVLQVGDARFPASLQFLVGANGGAGGRPAVPLAGIVGRREPLAWRSGNFFWFRALPEDAPAGWVFSGILPAFFGSPDPGGGGVVLAIEGFHAGCDPASLRRASDLLNADGRSFVVTVQMPRDGLDPAKAHGFLSALLYAQARGGRVFLIPPEGAFWDGSRDSPPEEAAVETALGELREQVRACIENGLLPLGVRLPDSGLGVMAAKRLAGDFGLAIGIGQASDATALATFVPATATSIAATLHVIPGGQIQDERSSRDARNILRLPGAIVTVPVSAWQPFEQIAAAITRADGLDAPFLDVSEASTATRGESCLFWTAAIGPVRPTFSGPARLVGYDGRGQPVSRREVMVASGEPVEVPEGATMASMLLPSP